MTKRHRMASEDRRRDLQQFIDAHDITVSRWAKEAGISEGTVRNFLAGRSETLTQATVEALAEALDVTASAIFPSQEKRRGRKGTRDALTFIAKSPGGFGAKDLPIMGTVQTGGRGLARGTATVTERPAYLKGIKTAYALGLRDPMMSPAFEPGWLVYVDPTENAKAGDNVVVHHVDGAVMVRRLVRRTKTEVVLRQFNPRKDTRFPAAEVASLHCIAGVRYRS